MWTGTETEIELFLIRHGKTRSNVEHRYLGVTDEGLLDEEMMWLKEQKKIKRYPACDHVFTSPLLRCRQTARLLYPDQEAVCIQEWKEIDFGTFEGKTYKELSGDPDYQKWIDSNGTLPFPKGESREKFMERSKKGFLKMLEILLKENKKKLKAAAIVHGGTIMTLCSFFTGGEYFDYQVKNREGYRCVLVYKGNNIKMKELEQLR